MKHENNTPAKKLKIGRVNASVFANESEQATWFSVTIDRVYKDKATGEFKRVSSFPEDELENIELAVRLAKEWIAEQRF